MNGRTGVSGVSAQGLIKTFQIAYLEVYLPRPVLVQLSSQGGCARRQNSRAKHFERRQQGLAFSISQRIQRSPFSGDRPEFLGMPSPLIRNDWPWLTTLPDGTVSEMPRPSRCVRTTREKPVRASEMVSVTCGPADQVSSARSAGKRRMGRHARSSGDRIRSSRSE